MSPSMEFKGSLKSVLKRVTGALPEPFKVWILQIAAKLPPTFRTYALYRYLLWIDSQLREDLVISTNMGISVNYHCQIPVALEPCVVWGKPEFQVGEWNSMQLCAFFSTFCDAFIDIGSYIGYYVFYVRSQLIDSKPIYYFEPVPEYFHIIQRNVSFNNLPNIYGSMQAVGDQTGTGVFYRNNSYSTCGSLTDRYIDRDKTETIDVPIISLASFIEANSLRNLCIKVDIEGAEDLFLQGALEHIEKISYLIIEVLDAQSDFLRKGNKLGFEIYHITSNGIRYCPSGVDTYIHNQWNWLFCRLGPEELQQQIAATGLKIERI